MALPFSFSLIMNCPHPMTNNYCYNCAKMKDQKAYDYQNK